MAVISAFETAGGIQIMETGAEADQIDCRMVWPEDDEWEAALLLVSTPRVEIPDPETPAGDDRMRVWNAPPPGLRARVYDPWIDPPHLLVDAELHGPDAALLFPDPGIYVLDMTADFPWMPKRMEVTI